MKNWILILLLFIAVPSFSQQGWEYKRMSDMPINTTNNALEGLILSQGAFVYSFGGIKDSLKRDEIHSSCFKYDVKNDNWSKVGKIPDSIPRFGAKASFIKNRIYLTGGFFYDSVFLIDQNESSLQRITSNKVNIFNPFLDTFEVDAAPLKLSVGEHSQAVWRDSLLYVISGVHSKSLSRQVQVYNPAFNTWSLATPVPDNHFFKSKGASASIIGDTIYYFGGVSGDAIMSSKNYLRKGVIDKSDPTQIEWYFVGSISGASTYKAVGSSHNRELFFFGGAGEGHQENGIAFNSQKRVQGKPLVFTYNTSSQEYSSVVETHFTFMDGGGIAKLGGGNWLIAGGIDSSGVASNRTLLLHNKSLSNISSATQPPEFKVISENNQFRIVTKNVGDIVVYDLTGKKLYEAGKGLADLLIPKDFFNSSYLIFIYDDSSNVPVSRKLYLMR